MLKIFYLNLFSLAQAYSLVLFDQQIGPHQMLPLWPRVYLGAMAIKGYSTFPKAPALLESYHQIV